MFYKYQIIYFMLFPVLCQLLQCLMFTLKQHREVTKANLKQSNGVKKHASVSNTHEKKIVLLEFVTCDCPPVNAYFTYKCARLSNIIISSVNQ